MCITCIMYQQLWGYKVEEKLYLGVREQKKVEYHWARGWTVCLLVAAVQRRSLTLSKWSSLSRNVQRKIMKYAVGLLGQPVSYLGLEPRTSSVRNGTADHCNITYAHQSFDRCGSIDLWPHSRLNAPVTRSNAWRDSLMFPHHSKHYSDLISSAALDRSNTGIRMEALGGRGV
jgi:hypothetical protein